MSKHKKPDEKTDESPKVFQRGKINFDLEIREFPWDETQKKIIETILDKNTKLVFINGPAGTGKTAISVYCGLQLLGKRSISDIIYVRSLAESASKSMGYLPGEQEDKFKPYMMPLEDKLQELLKNSDIKKLADDNRIHAIPVNFLRGASFNAKYILSEESQNFSIQEITTVLTRLGEFSKLIVIGDSNQSDIRDSGFSTLMKMFDNETAAQNGIKCFTLTRNDVKRSGILKFILETLEANNYGKK